MNFKCVYQNPLHYSFARAILFISIFINPPVKSKLHNNSNWYSISTLRVQCQCEILVETGILACSSFLCQFIIILHLSSCANCFKESQVIKIFTFIVKWFIILGVEAKESVGGFHKMLPKNKTAEFPSTATTTAYTAQRCTHQFPRSSSTSLIPCHGFYWKSGKNVIRQIPCYT